ALYMEHRDLTPERIDVFSLLATIALVVGIVLMAYWLGTLLHQTLSADFNEGFDSTAKTPDRLAGPFGHTASETPMEMKSEGPSPSLSEQEIKSKSYRIFSTSDGYMEQHGVTRVGKDAEPVPPVLNVVWEPAATAATRKSENNLGSSCEHLQLVSSAPVYVKRFHPSMQRIIEEPVVVNLYVESCTPAKEETTSL
ncbi:hypothetical protein V3C99_012075, partial [Haemonchus contortus]